MMVKRAASIVALAVLFAGHASAGTLDIYFIDVEGGQSTLVVTPTGQSLLIDAGYGGRGQRDADRILAAARAAHVDKIDYLLITHFHADHVGGVPDLAARIPIGTFIDYGAPLGTPIGADRMAVRSFPAYDRTRGEHPHMQPGPGARLPLEGIDVTVASAGGTLLPVPLPGAGQPTSGCDSVEHQVEDGTENYRSLGVLLQYGAFRFADLGDLSGDTLVGLVCPRNLLGTIDALLVPHHGNYDTSFPAVYDAFRPIVAVFNNSAAKGGDPAAFQVARAAASVQAVWQLHASANPDTKNSPGDFIANVDVQGSDGDWIKLTAREDGSFSVANGRTGFVETYRRQPREHTH
jgi:beta-lactamase superfamily II metal-dependent hydrolase